jgi:hypothetical protein
MNTNLDDANLNDSTADDARFDRLVDGELAESERRQLLATLDDEAGGWRRCALAFLEAQCWRESFDALRSPPRHSAQDPKSSGQEMAMVKNNATDAPTATASHRAFWSRHAGTLMAMAACFLAAFWISSLMRPKSVGPSPAPSDLIGQIADARRLPDVVEATQPAGDAAAVMPRDPASQASDSLATPWRMVTVAAPSASAASGAPLRLPAMERDKLDPQWLRSLPPAMPNDIVQALGKSGHQVEQHRELVPVPLQDGRQLIVPVDQVDVHYVGNGPY